MPSLGKVSYTRHLACAGGALAGLVLGLAAVAHAQTGDPGAASSALEQLAPPWAVAVVHDLGLPGALLVLGWWTRGVTLKGIPVVVSLSAEDRAELRRGRRAVERHVSDPSDSSEPAPGAVP